MGVAKSKSVKIYNITDYHLDDIVLRLTTDNKIIIVNLCDIVRFKPTINNNCILVTCTTEYVFTYNKKLDDIIMKLSNKTNNRKYFTASVASIKKIKHTAKQINNNIKKN
jgi:hypothetical protein